MVTAIDVAELQKQEVSAETVESWCVEEQAMEVDISLLQQVENLERRVISAGLQVKVELNHSSMHGGALYVLTFVMKYYIAITIFDHVSLRAGCILSPSQSGRIWFIMNTSSSVPLLQRRRDREKQARRNFLAAWCGGPTIPSIWLSSGWQSWRRTSSEGTLRDL